LPACEDRRDLAWAVVRMFEEMRRAPAAPADRL
jgi:hypothetical protein